MSSLAVEDLEDHDRSDLPTWRDLFGPCSASEEAPARGTVGADDPHGLAGSSSRDELALLYRGALRRRRKADHLEPERGLSQHHRHDPLEGCLVDLNLLVPAGFEGDGEDRFVGEILQRRCAVADGSDRWGWSVGIGRRRGRRVTARMRHRCVAASTREDLGGGKPRVDACVDRGWSWPVHSPARRAVLSREEDVRRREAPEDADDDHDADRQVDHAGPATPIGDFVHFVHFVQVARSRLADGPLELRERDDGVHRLDGAFGRPGSRLAGHRYVHALYGEPSVVRRDRRWRTRGFIAGRRRSRRLRLALAELLDGDLEDWRRGGGVDVADDHIVEPGVELVRDPLTCLLVFVRGRRLGSERIDEGHHVLEAAGRCSRELDQCRLEILLIERVQVVAEDLVGVGATSAGQEGRVDLDPPCSDPVVEERRVGIGGRRDTKREIVGPDLLAATVGLRRSSSVVSALVELVGNGFPRMGSVTLEAVVPPPRKDGPYTANSAKNLPSAVLKGKEHESPVSHGALRIEASSELLFRFMARGRQRSRSKTLLMFRLLRARLVRVGPVFLGVFLIVVVAVYLLERNAPDTHVTSLADSVWFTIVTLSTVGYGDIYPVTPAGRVLTGGFILFTLTAIGFLLTAINEAVLEVKRMEENGLIGTSMEGHVVVCGFGPVARTAIEELLAADRQVAVVCERVDDIREAQRYGPRDRLFVTAGEIDQDLLRDRLNAAAAQTAVIATDDDTKTIIASLNMHAVNPGARIIVSVKTDALRQTLIASGVTYVASPYELSGRLVASAAFEPEVAQLVEDITSGVDEGFDLHQYSAGPFDGDTVRTARKRLEELEGPLLIAVARWKEGGFDITPHPPSDLVLDRRDQVIVLANDQQAARMAESFKLQQGR